MPEHIFIVEELKTRLDKYLAKQLPEISRSQIQRDIEGGAVDVNGGIISESKFAVRLNDKIVYNKSEILNHKSEIQATNTPLKVLYNNHGLLIIDKPAGMVVHPGAGFKGETLASALLYHFSAKGGSRFAGKDDISVVGEDHRPGIVHRLDKETSGVILVAKTPEMYEFLKDAFFERKIKKEYIALVLGKMEKPHGFIETPIGKSRRDFRKQTTKDPVEGKEAVTEYRVLEYLAAPTTPSAFGGHPSLAGGDAPRLSASSAKVRSLSSFSKEEYPAKRGEVVGVDTYTLILVKLHTGRTHQIRVHLASVGHPLMGDELYGGKRVALKGLERQFLHAKKIEVRLPNETWIEAESELADDLKKVLANLNSKVVKNL
jgi:23S rRNA pseudouridine1911/1915/1917 synthase